MDFAAAARSRRRKPGQDASHFRVDDETGRFVFEEEVAKKAAPAKAPATAAEDVEGRAYMDQMVSVDGFTRTATGAVKFHKNTKKRRALEMEEGGDVDMAEDTEGDAKKTKRRSPIKIGREFRAKVSTTISPPGN